MTKKKSPIGPHKEKDAWALRELYLAIINATAKIKCPHCQETFDHRIIDVKNKIEAGKMLARMHHLLQVDKTVVNTKVETLQAQALAKPELKPELKDTLKNLLNAPGN